LPRICLEFSKLTGQFQSLQINEVSLKREKDLYRLHGSETIVEVLGLSRLQTIRQVGFIQKRKRSKEERDKSGEEKENGMCAKRETI